MEDWQETAGIIIGIVGVILGGFWGFDIGGTGGAILFGIIGWFVFSVVAALVIDETFINTIIKLFFWGAVIYGLISLITGQWGIR